MSVKRLQARVPSASPVSVATLSGHNLIFHKKGKDGTAKCDAEATGDRTHAVIGLLFEIEDSAKYELDRIEGDGYFEKTVAVETTDGEEVEAVTYCAARTDPLLKPFHWYKQHVLRGARENALPEAYIRLIEAVESVSDPDRERHSMELAIYG